MAFKTDKNSYTIVFAVIMVVIVGALLAFAANGLSEKILKINELKSNKIFCMQWVLMKMMTEAQYLFLKI